MVGAAVGPGSRVGAVVLSLIMVETVGSEVGPEIVTKTGEGLVSSSRSVLGWRIVTVDGANVGFALLTKDEGRLDGLMDVIIVGDNVGTFIDGGCDGLLVGTSVGLVVDALLPLHPHSARGATEI